MAATSSGYVSVGMKANSDLRNSRFLLVEVVGSELVDVCNSASDRPFGILMDGGKAGEGVEVAIHGIAKVKAGGTVAAGDVIGTDGSGQGVAKTAANDKVCGMAVTAAASGELFECCLGAGIGQRSN